ncbi:WD40-repeat-containing domain protein [Abortiporus biennis]|nr:WD40-repeat-containing domain protein [Abortiporus biennis]
MASPQKSSKKKTPKPPKSRPTNTSAVSHPTVEDAPFLFALSAFSPKGDLFAYVSLAVDKHYLRVYSIVSGQSVAEYLLDSSRITSLSWTSYHSSQDSDGHRKKRKRKNQLSEEVTGNKEHAQGVLIGLANGSLILFSPVLGKVVKSLSHPKSTSTITAICVDDGDVWTCSNDCVLRLWSLNDNGLLGSWKTDARTPFSVLSIRSIPSPSSDENLVDNTEILVANHGIQLLSMSHSSENQPSQQEKPRTLYSFTGHASSVKGLLWVSSSRFLSYAEGDRFVNLWQLPEDNGEGRVIASIPLDADVRSISLFSSPTDPNNQTLIALSNSGRISVVPLVVAETKASGIPTLTAKSHIVVGTTKSTDSSKPAQIISISSVLEEDGKVKVARLVGGVKLAFDVTEYLDATGDFISEVRLSPLSASVLASSASDGVKGATTKRYNESSSTAVRSGLELGQDASMDDVPTNDADGELDVDMAELSLGQRLTALTGTTQEDAGASSDEEPNKSKAEPSSSNAVPASSLTRTLIQALHSSDAGLLETCLAHSNANLIQNTVRRLPPQLAVPLITACVERLGRGKGVGRGKGGGAGAGAQRGTGLIRWIRAVLIIHGGHLLTMPDLVARLAGLHQTLTTRLALQENLLSLSGRLDMVISQIEMRSSEAPAPLPLPKKGKGKEKNVKAVNGKVPRKYVEGESEDDDDAVMVDVEVESGDESGSVEDVELGGSSEEEEDDDDVEDSEEGKDDDDEDDEDEDEDEDSEDGGGVRLNGFIDDEAEEFTGDEDDEESD